MIAYYFPPLGGIGSIRAAKFAQYLPEWGWAPTIVAPSNAPHPRDGSLDYDESAVVRARSFELSRLGKRLARVPAGDPDAARSSWARRPLRDLAHRFLYYPDPQIGWFPFALSAARRAVREKRFDAVFSSSFPITTHLVARRIRRESGIPWLAEFRDPWADVDQTRSDHQRREDLERRLLGEADSVLTVSGSWLALFREKGARRVALVTNGFDPADLPRPVPVDGFVVTHLGSLYPGMQDLRSLWTALQEVRASEPALGLKLRFVGEVASSVRAEISAAGLHDCLEVTGFLPQREALAATAQSSVLVMGGFHRDDPVYQGWLPAKLFEYLGTGLPIVYVGARDTEATRLLSSQPGTFLAATDDVAAIRQALVAGRKSGRVARELAPYTRRALAGGMARALDVAIEGQAADREPPRR